MENYSNVLVFNSIIKDLGLTVIEDITSEPKIFIIYELPQRFELLDAKNHDKSDDLQGEGMIFIIASIIIDIKIEVEVLLGLKKSGHSENKTKNIIKIFLIDFLLVKK